MIVVASIVTVSVAGSIGGLIVATAGLIVNTRRDARRDRVDDETHREERRDVARDEALALATVRGEQIDELERQLSDLRTQYTRERDEQLQTIDSLQRTIDLVRDQAFETIQMNAHGQRALLITILGDLERDPPHIDRAVTRIHEALSDAKPSLPGQR